MTSPLSLASLITFGLLSVSIVALWIHAPGHRRLRPPLWMGSLVLAMGSGLGFGFLEPVALVSILALGVGVYAIRQEALPVFLRLLGAFCVLGLAGAMFLHVAPGFNNPKVIDDVAIGHEAIPYTKYLNFDKPLIGLFILGFGPRLIPSARQWGRMFKAAGPYVPAIWIVVLLLSQAFGYVRIDIKWPPFWWFWIWTNLLFTCIAEEALFRGFIQRQLEGLLERYAFGPGVALVSAAVLFGLAHFAGGMAYMILAATAGLGYGFVYQRAQRIEAAILAHFSLNFVHFVFFTYPALASAAA